MINYTVDLTVNVEADDEDAATDIIADALTGYDVHFWEVKELNA